MATHFKLAHLYFSYTCLNAEPASCDSQICACPCHFTSDHNQTIWLTSMTGASILHLAYAYKRSPFYDPTFATAVKQAKLHPQGEPA